MSYAVSPLLCQYLHHVKGFRGLSANIVPPHKRAELHQSCVRGYRVCLSGPLRGVQGGS